MARGIHPRTLCCSHISPRQPKQCSPLQLTWRHHDPPSDELPPRTFDAAGLCTNCSADCDGCTAAADRCTSCRAGYKLSASTCGEASQVLYTRVPAHTGREDCRVVVVPAKSN